MILSQADLTASGPSEQALIAFYDKIAEQAGQPKVEVQKQMLVDMMAHFNTPQLLEPEIASCMYFKTKKSEKYIFSIEFQPHSPLRHCYEFVRVGLLGSGATLTDGPPPRGPLIRGIPKN